MSYKFYKSTTLKSVALNNDTNIIFDIANQNKTNVFLNTLLYQSSYGCPISFSLIQNVNSNHQAGFGSGGKLDFLYKLSCDNGEYIITHPTGDEETFIDGNTCKTFKNESGVITHYYCYYYSTSTTAYLIKIINDNEVINYYYVNGSFVTVYDVNLGNPIQFSRNGFGVKNFIDITYYSNKVKRLQNKAFNSEFVEFEYSIDCSHIKVYKFLDTQSTEPTQIYGISLLYENSKLTTISKYLHNIHNFIESYYFTYETDKISVYDRKSKQTSIVELLFDAVDKIIMQPNTLQVEYVDNYETKILYNQFIEKYFFDENINLQHIENSLNEIKVFNFDYSVRNLLLSQSGNLFDNNYYNFPEFYTLDETGISSNNGCSFGYSRDTLGPTGIEYRKISFEQQDSSCAIRFYKSGKKYDVENVVFWYRIASKPANATKNDLQATLQFYKGNEVVASLISTETISLNGTICGKCFVNILAAQAASDYDYVDVVITSSKSGYILDTNVELLSDSFVGIYKYDSLGRVIKTLNGKQINTYSYDIDNNLRSSSILDVSYDENNDIELLVSANNMQRKILRDSYGNVLSQKTYNIDKSKYIETTKEYSNYECVSRENTENDLTFLYTYDSYKRPKRVLMSFGSSNHDIKIISYSDSSADYNYGVVNKIMNAHNEENLQGSLIERDENGNISKLSQINETFEEQHSYQYQYDTFNRITSVSFGDKIIFSCTYSDEDENKSILLYINNKIIKYQYDEFERLVAIKEVNQNDEVVQELYTYNYNENANILTSIYDHVTNQTTSFSYNGFQLNEIEQGEVSTSYVYNENKNKIFEKKMYNNNLISMEKTSDSSTNSYKDNIIKCKNDILVNEGDTTFVSVFTKATKKEKNGETVELSDETKSLVNYGTQTTIECINNGTINEKYQFDGLPCVAFSSSDEPLNYHFNDDLNVQGQRSGLGNNYTVLFGYKLDSSNDFVQLLYLNQYNYSGYISVSIKSGKLRLQVGNEYVDYNIQEKYSLFNFIALNVSVTKDNTKFRHTVDVFYNGVLLGTKANIVLDNTMTNLFIMNNEKTGKICSLIVKTKEQISPENIKAYTERFSKINTEDNIKKHYYNKKIRLRDTQLPIIYFDNTFDSINGTVKPYSLKYSNYINSKNDCFVGDYDSGDTALLLKSQKLAYNFNLSTSGVVGVRFKKEADLPTNIFSLNDDKMYVHVKLGYSNSIEVTINGNYYTPGTLLDGYNNIFFKWSKIVSSDSVEEYIYAVSLFINGVEYQLPDQTLTGDITRMIMSIGQCYLNNLDSYDNLGLVEKAVGCDVTTSVNTLNNLFSNPGDGVLNKYNEFNQKTRKEVTMFNNSNKITNYYTFDGGASEGRVVGLLTGYNVVISSSKVISGSLQYNEKHLLKNHSKYVSWLNSNVTETFTYDLKNQLTEYVDGTNTYKYEYDNSGNITKIKKGSQTIHTATYEGILLKNTDGCTINYDSNGYPVSKYSNGVEIERYSWLNGKLVKLEYPVQQKTFTFTYNSSGLRTKKVEHRNNVEYNISKYYYDASGLLIYETRSLDNVNLEYLYDAEGELYGYRFDGDTYFYIKDALGTILYLVDEALNIVSEFNYEGAFGKHTITDVLGVANINPFRYKGYYYDVETQLYWVSSRYYSPELCRWISPDSIEYLNPQSINGLNLYAYCGNDPVNKYDPTGHFALSATALVWIAFGVSAIVGATASVINQGIATDWQNINVLQVVWDAGIAGIGGALSMSPLGWGAMIVANTALGFVGSVGGHLIQGHDLFGANAGEYWTDIGISTLIGAGIGLIGGPGAQRGLNLNVLQQNFVSAYDDMVATGAKVASGYYKTAGMAAIHMNKATARCSAAFLMYSSSYANMLSSITWSIYNSSVVTLGTSWLTAVM